MNARPKFYLDLADAAVIVHGPLTTPLAERDPDIDEARAAEAREEWKREADEYKAEGE